MNKRAFGALITYVGVMAVGMVVIRVLVRATDGPDFSVTMKMRGWNAVKGASYKQAEFWGRVGLKAESMYNKVCG